MRSEDQAILKEFAVRVRELYPEARIWAFGSRVRGLGAEDSDFDICVVLDSFDPHIRDSISDVAWEVGFARQVLIATVVFSREMFEHGPPSAGPLVKAILQEGVAA